MEVVSVFYGHLVFCTAIWYVYFWPFHTYNLWSFGIFFTFWYVLPRKIWQPWLEEKTSLCPLATKNILEVK
jgi:hypothetical protein